MIPSAFAVLRLMISSTLVSCRTGRSAGFSPLRTLSTKTAARRVSDQQHPARSSSSPPPPRCPSSQKLSVGDA